MRNYKLVFIILFSISGSILPKYRHQKQQTPERTLANNTKNISDPEHIEIVIQPNEDKKPTFTQKKIEYENEVVHEKISLKNTKKEQKTQSSPLLDVFCAPILFSDAGFRCYIKHRYNRTEYNDFLPLCFTDMLEFLTYGMQQNSRDYPKRILNLFHKKLKESSFVNAFAFDDLLEKMPATLAHYFPKPRSKRPLLKYNFNNILYANFLQNFDVFKAEPSQFLEKLSGSLADLAFENLIDQDDTTQDELKGMIMRFMEHGFSKLIWSPEEGEEVWNSFKSLAKHIDEFGKQGIFTFQEDLDDLYWSLITRFGYFIELSGSQLTPAVYEKMYNDLKYDELYFLDIEEQEDFIQTKKEYITKIIKSGSAKSHANAMGFISEIIAT